MSKLDSIRRGAAAVCSPRVRGAEIVATCRQCVLLAAIGIAAGTGLALAPAVAQAATGQIRPSAHVQAKLVPAGAPGVRGPREPRTIPVLVRNPAAYARAKRTASGAGPKRASRAPSSASQAGAQTAVFGTLSAPGLSAAQQISAFGESSDTTPPDTTGTIGPADYVEIVNSEVAVYDRTDLTLVGTPIDVATFAGGVSPCDVQVKYDPGSDRWYYLALRCDGTISNNELYVGWSKTSDPSNLTTGWCKFTVASTPASSLDDYPKLGLDGNHVIIGANNFDASSMVFETAHILVAAKPAAGTLGSCAPPGFTVFGSSASPLKTTSGNLAFTPEPATVTDSSSPTGYVVAADFDDSTSDQSGSKLMLWQVGDLGGSPTLVSDGDVAVSSFAVPASVSQPGTTDTIDTLDGRLTQAVASPDPNANSTEAIWTQHTVSDGSGGAIVRWYELVPSTMTLRQSGTISDSAGFAFNGAIAPTRNGGAVIDYNIGGSTQEVAIKAQSRVATDTLGTMTAPITLASSSAIDSDFSCPSQPFGASSGTGVCRWGDYAGASVDPDNPDVAWGSSQVNGPTGAFINRFGDQAQWISENFGLTPTTTPAPTASFTIGPNPSSPGAAVSFDATASSDSAGITDHSWSFGDGSPIDDTGTVATASHPYQIGGVYIVTLTVTDSGDRTSSSSHTVTVDAFPTASFTLSPNPVTPGAPVVFDAGSSSDPNPGGAITSYSWSFGEGSSDDGITTTHSYFSPGTYTVTLTVTDQHGQTATATQNVVVDQPSASFTASPIPATPAALISFNATASSDPAGTITSYSWSFGDGGSGSGATPSHSFAAAGSYAVTLSVTNNHGQVATASKTVTVNAPPTAALAIAPNPAIVGSSVSFDASGSSHPPGVSAGYTWTFGDGTVANGAIVSHSYSAPGSYGVTLVVVDSDGQMATTTGHVTVKPPPLQGHLANLTRQKLPAVRKHGLPVTLSINYGGRATFTVTASIKPTKGRRKGSILTLLRGRTLSVASGRHRFTLKLNAAATRRLPANQVVTLSVRVTLIDAFGQKLTLSGNVTLKT